MATTGFVINILMVIGGLVGLFLGGESLIKGASRLANSLGVPAVVIGLTIVAIGTSSPELVVAIDASLQQSGEMVLGNVIGSNIANIGLILGISGTILPLTVHWRLIRREIPILIGVSVFVVIMALDGKFGLLDGIVLTSGLVVFVTYLLWEARRSPAEINVEYEEFERKEGVIGVPINRWLEVGRILAGIVLLVLGADFLVDGASRIALALGVSEFVIGLTLVAVGTSLPELATSVVATIRRETDIAVGNIIGSNITNLLLILGVSAIIGPVPVANPQLMVEFPVMVAFSLTAAIFALDRIVDRWQAASLVALYGGFLGYLVIFR